MGLAYLLVAQAVSSQSRDKIPMVTLDGLSWVVQVLPHN